jgi:hypothetical protein
VADGADAVHLAQEPGHADGVAEGAGPQPSRRLRIRDGGNAEELLADRMAGARAVAARFPRLRARLDTAAADYAAAPEHSFEFGLQAIFDGLEAQLVAKGTPGGQ